MPICDTCGGAGRTTQANAIASKRRVLVPCKTCKGTGRGAETQFDWRIERPVSTDRHLSPRLPKGEEDE